MKFSKLILTAVSLIVIILALYVWGNFRQKFVLRELIPEVQRDRINPEYYTSIIDLYPTFTQDPFPPLTDEEGKIVDKIIEIDSEIIIPQDQDKRFSVYLLPRDPTSPFVPYFGTERFSCPGDGFSPSCVTKSDLKIFNLEDNSIHKVINTEFTEGITIFELGKMFLLKNKNQFFIFGGKNFPGEYIIYNLISNTIQFDGRRDSIKTLSFGEYLVSYDAQNSMLNFKNIIKESEASCSLNEYGNVRAVLDKSFDYQHFTLSPTGKNFLIFSDKTDVYASQMEMDPEKSSLLCTKIREGEVANMRTLYDIGYKYQAHDNDIETNWYNDGRFFAIVTYGADVVIYDFQSNKLTTNFPIANALSAGVQTNDGYLSDANLGYKGYILRTSKTLNGLEVSLVDSNGKSQVLASYTNPPFPLQTWIMINKGEGEGIFQILVLDGYVLRHLAELSIK